MNEELIKTVIAQEKLNEICVNAFDVSHPIWQIVSSIKEDKQSRNSMIDIIYADYLINNYNAKDNNKLGICNFIINFAKNKDILYGNFIDNTGMANELVNSYYNGYCSIPSVALWQIKDSKIKDTIYKLSPFFNSFSFNYLPSLVRFYIMQIIDKNVVKEELLINLNNIFPINENLIVSIIISDVYTYMCYNNENQEFNNYINMIENNCDNLTQLWKILLQKGCLDSFLIYFVNLFLLDDDYTEIYKINANKNHNFISILKKINPYYLLDEIQDYNIKKYRR